ncbi:MAG: ribonuclease P protein component, partial [Lentisphaerota bacterium]
ETSRAIISEVTMPGNQGSSNGIGEPPASGTADPQGDSSLPTQAGAGKGCCRETLGKRQKLVRSADFMEAYAQGRRGIGRYMVMWLRNGEGASLRLGVVASKKVGGAVQRTRAKRLLREAYRRNRAAFSGPVDVVLVARREILQASWPNLVAELKDLARKAGLTD